MHKINLDPLDKISSSDHDASGGARTRYRKTPVFVRKAAKEPIFFHQSRQSPPVWGTRNFTACSKRPGTSLGRSSGESRWLGRCAQTKGQRPINGNADDRYFLEINRSGPQDLLCNESSKIRRNMRKPHHFERGLWRTS
ncbi:hypothetical protein PoB_005445700 [Plakobranchus ocellatus]|uniref:Uncharacterized protein n=1 Tax=Plakobranchus ocellatus TaxID=259542 RepID=A0AAV4C9C3_9GAST|nr:hypothetical protein PoB_005445700 [Plakobranchus ocellatus]